MPRLRLRSIAAPAFALVLFCFAMRLLWREWQKTSWEQFQDDLTSVPTTFLIIAAVLITMNYVLFTAYDLLALRYLCRSIPLRRVALVAFLGYSLGNNLGNILAGAPIRFRFYSRWGLSPSQIVALVSMIGLTFWSGFCLFCGTILVVSPIELPPEYALPFETRWIGVALLAIFAAYATLCFTAKKPLPLFSARLRPPEPGLMGLQSCVSIIDLFISATALYLVLPPDANVPYLVVVAAYLAAISIALISQIPGGLGILELILQFLIAGVAGDQILASLLIFRFLYYIIPLLVGMVALVGHEIYGGAMEAKQSRLEVGAET